MGNRGGNAGRRQAQSGRSGRVNRRNEAVHRDPDIGGVMRRHAKSRSTRERSMLITFIMWVFRR